MSFFSNIFGKSNIECPRCLGKGHVDWDDIRRLNQELKWAPGKCAYCEGKGAVNSKLAENVSPDDTYLTIDKTQIERDRYKANDEAAMRRAEIQEAHHNYLIKQIVFLYFEADLGPDKIAEFFMIDEASDPKRKEDLVDYILKVVEFKRQ